jgi:hypothetical protein
MEQKSWTAEEWARQAGISGTTITRFLNFDDPGRTPSTRTLEKLRSAAGLPPMQETNQILIGVVRRNALLDAVRRTPHQVDIFTMDPDSYVAAPAKNADCCLAEMDNGRFAICRKADPVPGKPVLVARGDTSIAAYWYEPPVLVAVETGGQGPHSLPLASPHHQILGLMVGEYISYE